MDTTTILLPSELDQKLISETYEVVSYESLSDCNHENLIISGSLLSHNHFFNVTFINCVFFSSTIENCIFEGCKLINCKFEFSNISNSRFSSCNFKNITWNIAYLTGSIFSYCILDVKTMYYVTKNENSLQSCLCELDVSAA